MTDYTHGTGSGGTMLIRDTGTTVEFWVKAGSTGTYAYQMPYGWTVNGVTGTSTARYEQGAAYLKLKVFTVSSSQTVTFRLGATGTNGLGGPTTFSQAISRSTVPNAPTSLTLSGITASTVNVAFTDGANNGAAIDQRQIAYGPTLTGTHTYIGSDGSTTVTGLKPGTLYYFWARTHNSRGWSAFTGPKTAKTTSTVSIFVVTSASGRWRQAIPYVKVAGVWRQAEPWRRTAGVWKKTG